MSEQERQLRLEVGIAQMRLANYLLDQISIRLAKRRGAMQPRPTGSGLAISTKGG